MRLILKLGYNYFLFPEGINKAEVIEGFAGSLAVSHDGYGKDETFTISEQQENIEVHLVQDSKILAKGKDNDEPILG